MPTVLYDWLSWQIQNDWYEYNNKHNLNDIASISAFNHWLLNSYISDDKYIRQFAQLLYGLALPYFTKKSIRNKC